MSGTKMRTRVQWIGHRSFVAETGSGHTVVMDGAPEHGGRNLAARPMEMVLVALGGCTAFDVMHVLEKAQQQVVSCVVEVEGARADSIPAVYTDIHLVYVVSGKDLIENHVRRAVELSVEKYCSVSAMLKASVKITHEYKIVETGK